MPRHVGEPEDPRVGDELAQHAAAVREVADDLALVLVDADRQEAREPVPLVVEDAERRVARPGQLLRGAEHSAQDLLELVDVEQLVEDRDEAAGGRVHRAQASSRLCSMA